MSDYSKKMTKLGADLTTDLKPCKSAVNEMLDSADKLGYKDPRAMP
jgi:hypothetical protein